MFPLIFFLRTKDQFSGGQGEKGQGAGSRQREASAAASAPPNLHPPTPPPPMRRESEAEVPASLSRTNFLSVTDGVWQPQLGKLFLLNSSKLYTVVL